jgi:HAL2 family 3'(2'),5'-bisphosphate nucleotidase
MERQTETMKYQKEITTAIEAVRKASLVCHTAQQRLVTIETIEKGDRSPVTVADYVSQAIINREIFTAFPSDDILGEEDTKLLRKHPDILSSVSALADVHGFEIAPAEILDMIDRGKNFSGSKDRFWTVDPIDGTKGFLRGDQYAVALALIENGSAVLGVLGCPNLPWSDHGETNDAGCVFYAFSGYGSRQRSISDGQMEKVITTDGRSDPSLAVFCESVESAHAAHGTHARIAEKLGVTAPPCRMDSQAKYAAVARGEASIYLRLPRSADYREKIWDHAAGTILVQEAGGRVTDFFGKPLDFSHGKTLENNRGIVASNGVLHDAILETIQQSMAEFQSQP